MTQLWESNGDGKYKKRGKIPGKICYDSKRFPGMQSVAYRTNPTKNVSWPRREYKKGGATVDTPVQRVSSLFPFF